MSGARILGCGNLDRGDDAAGVLVARRLREMGVKALEHSGEGLSLMDAWAGADDVVVVDTAVTGAAAGTLHAWDSNIPANTTRGRGSSHSFGVGEAIRLAHALERLPRRLRVFGIEGSSFSHGAPLGAEVAAAVESLARLLAAESRSWVKATVANRCEPSEQSGHLAEPAA